MSLSNLASLGSFVSGVAVLVSLVFLYFQLRQVNAQVRQSEKNQQALIKQGHTNRIVDIDLRLSDASVAEAGFKVRSRSDDLTAVHVRQFLAVANAYFVHCEEAF